MPKDILNIVFAPQKFSAVTNSDDVITWEQARKRMHQFYSKPFLIGNPKSIKPPIKYPCKKANPNHKILCNLICLWWGDITKLKIESIVNSANIKLKNGGGVCGAIHRCSGDELFKECNTKYPNGCNVTDCIVTNGYKLPSQLVIHAVGPSQMHHYKLSQTYKNVLKLCIQNNIKQVCFSCIGCGTHDLPMKEASKVAVYSVVTYLTEPYVDDNKKDKQNRQKLDKQKHENKNDENKENIIKIDDKIENKIDPMDDKIENKIEDKNEENQNDAKEAELAKDKNEQKKENQNETKFAYEYFDKIVFNCWTEQELEAWKWRLTEKLG